MRGAVIDALDTAAAALRAGGLEGYEQAHKQWRSAHAAMQILGHRALIQFSGELGEHVAKQDAASNATNAEQRAASFAGGVQALKAYVDTLSAGRSDQPLTLWPAYEALQLARGVTQPMPSDLFFPDTAQGPGARAGAPQLSADDLRAARRAYEGGLLAWMRKVDDGAALKPLSEVAARVEAAQTDPVMRRPWWALRAVLDALQNNGLESDVLVRRVLTQMNLLLGRMINGSVEPPDALTRDALYLAAKAQPVTPLITGVQRVFGLTGMLDVSEPVALAFSAEVATVAVKSVENLQTVWTECAAGNAKCSEFASRAQSLTSQCEKLGVPALTALTAQLATSAHTLAQRGGTVPDAAALEIACALLMLENGLASGNAPLPEFDARAAHMAMRVGISVESPDALKTMAPAQLIDEESRRKQLAVPLALAYDEITRALHDTELTLDGWFANPSNPDAVAGLDKPMRQATGALAVLGHAEAAGISGACRADIARYARGAKCDAAEQRGLATRLAALTAYVEAAKQGSTDLRQVLERAGVIEVKAREAEPEMPLMSTMMIERGAEFLAVPALAPPEPPSLDLGFFCFTALL